MPYSNNGLRKRDVRRRTRRLLSPHDAAAGEATPRGNAAGAVQGENTTYTSRRVVEVSDLYKKAAGVNTWRRMTVAGTLVSSSTRTAYPTVGRAFEMRQSLASRLQRDSCGVWKTTDQVYINRWSVHVVNN